MIERMRGGGEKIARLSAEMNNDDERGVEKLMRENRVIEMRDEMR